MAHPASDIEHCGLHAETLLINIETQPVAHTVTQWTQREPSEINPWTKPIADTVTMWMQAENKTVIPWSQGESQAIINPWNCLWLKQ